MKFAITADLHLRSRQQTPERFAALENIFSQLRALKIETLIIAGDLFDAQYNNYSEFEAVCRLPENRNIQVLIIPGNHDPNISQSGITTKNVHIFSQPELVSFGANSVKLFFIPYSSQKNIGEVLAEFSNQLSAGQWGIVSHGDWSGNTKATNSYEQGRYMPLYQCDLDAYKPIKAFMGHIHAPYNSQPVYYPGSPCGLDITETGRRRFITYDSASDLVESQIVDTEHIYFNRTFVIYPVDDEQAATQNLLHDWIESWGLSQNEKSKARIRVTLRGYATDKSKLKQVLLDSLSGYKLVEEPELDDVLIATDQRRSQILDLVKEKITELNWPENPGEPNKDQILLEAIKLVYGG